MTMVATVTMRVTQTRVKKGTLLQVKQYEIRGTRPPALVSVPSKLIQVKAAFQIASGHPRIELGYSNLVQSSWC